MAVEGGYKEYFGYDLAKILSTKIIAVHSEFNEESFLAEIQQKGISGLELLARVQLIAETLHEHLPASYPVAMGVLVDILGPENEKETGMFTFGYWLWPVATYVGMYGLDDFEISIAAIEEVTKRHTGEHAIRPFINARPGDVARIMLGWAQSENVHVRRLASEGLRPRLPWSKRLHVFVADPAPVFLVLDELKDDQSKFVQKSVANNVNDYLKENRVEAIELLKRWKREATPEREWIIKHALRNELKRGEADAMALANF